MRIDHLALLSTITLFGLGCGDPVAPAAPELDSLAALTNQAAISITGTAEASARVQVRGGAEAVAETNADADGRFVVSVPLRVDVENQLLVSQLVGGVESPAATVAILHDGMPPALPELTPAATPTRVASPTLRGQTEANAEILVTGGREPTMVAADATGQFAIVVMLETSAVDAVDNDLSLVARDAAGNDSPPVAVTITFDPNLPVEAPLFDAFPAYTASDTVTLAGAAEPGAGITVVGGATDGTATVAADGSFSVELGLRPNQTNNLLAFAISGTDTSPSSALRITHDDIAPDAPELEPEASPTGAEIAYLAGLTEPGAVIAVTGGASTATATAGLDGLFTVDVTLSEDADNALSILAMDLAGNLSEASLLTITQDSSLESPISLDPMMSPTSDIVAHLSGHAAPSVAIEITGGAAPILTTSDSAGVFSADVTLTANTRNDLHVTRPLSGVEALVTIEHDDIAPESPDINALPSPTGSTTVTVSGVSESRARVAVTGATAPAAMTTGLDGRFSIDLVIVADNESTLTAIATDRAGNASSPVSVSITHSSEIPAAPQLDEDNPTPTSALEYVVTGRVANPGEGVTVRIRGGSVEATNTAHPTSGLFSVGVELRANQSNELSVVSIDGSLASSEALVTIVHDDIEPSAPIGASMSASSNMCPAGIVTGGNVSGSMGAVEARARVRVENLTHVRQATTTATDGGSFNVSLGSCTGDVIRVIAIDAAANESASTEINAG